MMDDVPIAIKNDSFSIG